MLFFLEPNALWVVGVVLAATGGGMMGVGIRPLYRMITSRRWPTVEGRIIHSLVEMHRERPSQGREEVTYVPRIKYEYEVQGRRYTADGVGFGLMTTRVGFGGMFSNAEGRVRKLVDRYPVGRRVPVCYNPRRPSVAALERWHAVGTSVMLVLIGTLFLLFGVRMF